MADKNNQYEQSLEYAAKLFQLITGQKLEKAEDYDIKFFIDAIHHFYKKLLACMPANVYWWNRNNRCLGVNNNVLKLMGVNSSDELIGKSYQEVVKIAGWEKAKADFFESEDKFVMENNEPKLNVDENIPMVTPDGKKIYYSTSRVPLHDKNGKVIGIVGISTDITEIKLTQKKLEKANKVKDEFIANMSHDIRTPITGAVGMIQGLINLADETKRQLSTGQPLSFSEQKKMVQEIDDYSQILMSSTDQLLNLCNEILEVIDLESGKTAQSAESFSLQELMEHTVELLEPVAKDRNLGLSFEIANNIPVYLKGLRIYLSRILLNLTSNALKFTEKGFVKISTSLESMPDKQDNMVYLRIAVSDSGIGIPQDKFKEIFKHFSRLTPSYKGIYKGSGLGLYAVKKYIETMNGKITVKSEIGKGSEFTLVVPLEISDHSDQTNDSVRLKKSDIPHQSDSKSKRLNLEPDADDGKINILLVEDSDIAALSARISLKQCNCNVTWAANGKEALLKAQEKCHDLILMDIGLPDTTGLEVTKQIRNLSDNKLASVPIVALTGHVNKREECLAAGMQDMLNKPAQPLALQKILEKYVFNKTKLKNTDKPLDNEAISVDKLAVIDWEVSVKMAFNEEENLIDVLPILFNELHYTESKLSESWKTQDTEKLLFEVYRCLGGICYLKLPQLDYTFKAFRKALENNPQDTKEMNNAYKDAIKAIHAFYDYYNKYIAHRIIEN